MANVLKSIPPDATSGSDESEIRAAREISGLAGFNLTDLAEEGRDRVKQCQIEIERMLAAAHADAQQIRKTAREDGYANGERQAAVDAEEKLKKASERRAKEGLVLLEGAVEQMHRRYEEWMQSYAQSLHRVAIAVAEKVARRELDDRAELIVSWAQEAVQSTRSASRLSVAVHPEILAQLGEQFDEMLSAPDLPEEAHVVPDANLKKSEVAVRQTGGDIQAGLEAQLERLSELLA